MKQIEELYDKYSKQVFHYFYYLTYDIHISNDLTQETFYQVIISIVRFNGRSKISTWIYSIARNTYLKYLRKQGRAMTVPDENFYGEVRDLSSYTPEEALERKERLESIAAVLKGIPEKYATILVLRDREGLSYRDIAQILGMTESVVKVTLFRARNRFKEDYRRIERGE